MGSALSRDELSAIDAYWRAANYLSVGQIYLLDNPLLRQSLTPEHIKPRLLGHWGTTPGLNFIYVHLNRAIKKYDLDMIYVCGPGHGGPGMVANTYLEGTYSELYPSVSQDAEGTAGPPRPLGLRLRARGAGEDLRRTQRRVRARRGPDQALRGQQRLAATQYPRPQPDPQLPAGDPRRAEAAVPQAHLRVPLPQHAHAPVPPHRPGWASDSPRRPKCAPPHQESSDRDVVWADCSSPGDLIFSPIGVNGKRSLARAELSVSHLKEYFALRRVVDLGTRVVRQYIARRQSDGARNATINRGSPRKRSRGPSPEGSCSSVASRRRVPSSTWPSRRSGASSSVVSRRWGRPPSPSSR
jgi:XFP N-terminal domain